MNKGLRLRFCKECNRKRFCKRKRIPGHNFEITCSQGHVWILRGITTERVVAAMEEVLTPERLKGLFDRDNAFYSALRKY